MIPKGKLLIIGGAEDRGEDRDGPYMKWRNKIFRHFEILGELLPPDPAKEHKLEIITTASEEPEEMSRVYFEAFRQAGFKDKQPKNIKNKDQARDPELRRRIEKADAVLFTGGNQLRLTTIIGGTEIIDVISRKYKEQKDFIVAGTSAGAMVMSRLMIYQGVSNEALLKGDVKISSGFGLIDNCIIDTHFVKRGRFGRLAQAIIMNPTCVGMGLGEDTALIIKKGNETECRGSGMVTIIDGREMGHTNFTYAEDETPISVENLIVHLLHRGDGYMIKERKFVVSKRDETANKTNIV